MRTHTCGELRREHEGRTVTLAGWVHRVRDHGNLVFVDLRDRYGRTQLVFRGEASAAHMESARALKAECVIRAQGKVALRTAENVNPKLSTGEVEVLATDVEVLNTCGNLPFEIVEDVDPTLELRLRYRYLDLRREKMRERLLLRHRMVAAMRRHLWSKEFVEIETPCLTRSTPEGARDYLVPSRITRGAFYALPQSPQILKQILMVSGLDRYFQIVRCFRDEDLRADRQPEFTQLDLEMSFVGMEDVLALVEGIVQAVFKETIGREVKLPLPRMSWQESMDRFGRDAPDVRYGLELVDVTKICAGSEFRVFKDAIARRGTVRGIRLPRGGARSRSQIAELEAFAKEFGAGGLAWFKVEKEDLSGPIAKFFSTDAKRALRAAFEAAEGDLLLFVADKNETVWAVLDKLRQRLAKEENLADPNRFELLWVVDFPLYEYSADEGRWVSRHHPFTSPHPDDVERLESDPANVRAVAYDLVLNGFELGGGSIRIHRRDLQERVFASLGFSREKMLQDFGWFLECLELGAPPHGGIALGVDRMAMLLAGVDNIREVIAFPKTARASCPLTGAPAPVEEKLLRELGVRVVEE